MADSCNYNIHARGRKAVCLMLFAAMSCDDAKYITKAEGMADDFVIHFKGSCKYGVDAYCDEKYDGEIDLSEIEAYDFNMPEDEEDAEFLDLEELGLDYWYITMQKKSELLNLEIQVQAYSYGEYIGITHLKNGEILSDDGEAWPEDWDTYEDPGDDGFDF